LEDAEGERWEEQGEELDGVADVEGEEVDVDYGVGL
jgi:hypothetical protein